MKKLVYIALAVLCASACNVKAPKTEAPKAEAPAAEVAKRITVTKAQARSVAQTETYSSTVQAYAINNIAPQNGNRIKKINVDVGSFVTKGQVLAQMDDVQLQQQKLQLSNRETELSRLKQLYTQGGLSESDYEAAELQFEVAKSTYQNLEENVILRSPINGVITARNYDTGDMYTMGQPLFTVQQIVPVKLLVGVSETDYTKVRKGQEVRIIADALPGKTFKGKVNKIYPTMDAASRSFKVEVVVSNADKALRPGMYCKVTLDFGSRKNIVVPDDSVVKQLGSGQYFVYVVNEAGTVSSRPVTLGRHFDNSYEILSGLTEGETLAVSGASALRDGSPVEIVER